MTDADLDEILTLQLAFAWAGESAADAEDRRLGWWKTDMTTEFGGLALMKRLTPKTHEWAAYEAARAAAREVDARRRGDDAGADHLVSLFHLGHPTDEALEDRLYALKSTATSLKDALPRLWALVGDAWDREAFVAWLDVGKPPKHDAEPAGRKVRGSKPDSPLACARTLAAVLATLPEQYPGAYFRDDASR